MPGIESCTNFKCRKENTCAIVGSLERIRDSGVPIPQQEFSQLAEAKRRTRVIFDCPNPISNLLTQIKRK